MAELKLVVGADVKEAEQALRSLVTNIDRTTVSIQKFSTDVSSFGRLPLHSIDNIRKAFLELKSDLSNVKFAAIPPVTADTRPAQQSLKVLTDNVKTTALSVGTISASFDKFSSDVNKSLGALSTASLNNFKKAFLDFKSDLSNVKISALPPVTIETQVAQISLRNFAAKVDTTMDGIRADLGNLKVAPIQPADINTAPANQSLKGLVNTIKLTGTTIVGASASIEKFSSDTRKALGALPLHNIEAFRQAFLNFKADLGNIKISAIPPIKVDSTPAQQSLQTLAQQAEKTGASVSNVALSFQRFSQSISKSFGALPLASIGAFRDAFQDFKSDLTNVKITAIPPVKVDTTQAQSNLRAVTKESEISGTAVNDLSARYQRWGGIAAIANAEAANSLKQVSQGITSVETIAQKGFDSVVGNVNQTVAAFQRFTAQLNQSVGALSLKSVEDLRKGVAALKSDLSSVKITAIPPIEANVKPAVQSIQTLTNEAEKSGVAVANVSSAYAKGMQIISQSSKQAVTAIKEIDITVETLRAKIATRRDLIVTEKDLSKIAKYNREIESLESILTQVQNHGKTGFFTGKPLDVLTDKTNKATAALTRLPTGSRQASQALLNLGRIAQDAPFGFIAIQNNLTELLPSFRALRQEAGSTGKAMKLFFSSIAGVGGIGLGISILTSLITFFSMRTKQAKEETDGFADSIRNLTSSLGGDATKVTSLMQALSGDTLNPAQKKAALTELKEINKEYFGSLKEENGIIVGLQAAYDGYLQRLVAVGRTKAIESQLTKLFAKKLELELSVDPKFISATLSTVQKQIGGLKTELDKLGGSLKPEELNAPDFITNKSLQRRAELVKQIADLSRGANVAFLAEDFEKVNNELGSTNLQIKGLSELLKNVGEFDIKLPDVKKEGKTVDDFIARAKRLNDELEKIGFLPPVRFSFFDTFEEELAKAKKVFDDFNSKNLKINPKVFTFPSFSEPEIKRKVDRALDVVREGIRAGIIGLPSIPLTVDIDTNLVTDFTQNATLVREFKDRFQNLSKLFPKIDMEMAAGFNTGVFVDALRKFFKFSKDATQQEILSYGDFVEKQLTQLGAGISASIESIATGSLGAIGEAFGEALAGGEISNVFQAFANVLADGIAAIGKQYIQFGAAALLAKKALKFLILKPELAIAAGVALVAAAAALRASINKGVTGFAEGGLVFGPTMGLIGEGVGTTRSNPEVIAPLDQLKKMLGDTGGNRLQPIVLRTAVRGDNLLLIQHRTTRRQGRTR